MKKTIHIQSCTHENTAPDKAAMNYFGLLLFLAMAFFALPAFAQDKAGNVQKIYSPGQMYPGTSGCDSSASKGCDLNNHVWDAQMAATYNVNKYSRKDAKAINLFWDYKVPPVYPEQGCPQAQYQAGGEYTCQTNATWRYAATTGTLCWGAHTLYSPPNCKGVRNVNSFPAQQAGNRVSASNTCSSGACVVDYQAATANHFVTADTGDNQMAMLPVSAGAKGFLVYNYCGSVPYWIERQSPEPSKYLMIPSKCQDYQTFIDAKPSAAKVEAACHPASLSLCPSPPSRPAMPAHPGCGGGRPHGSSWCSKGWETITPPCTTDSKGVKTCPPSYQSCKGYSYCDCGVVDGVGSVPAAPVPAGSCPPASTGTWSVTQPKACPTECGQPAQTLYGSVSCVGGTCAGAKPAIPKRVCNATKACVEAPNEPKSGTRLTIKALICDSGHPSYPEGVGNVNQKQRIISQYREFNYAKRCPELDGYVYWQNEWNKLVQEGLSNGTYPNMAAAIEGAWPQVLDWMWAAAVRNGEHLTSYAEAFLHPYCTTYARQYFNNNTLQAKYVHNSGDTCEIQ